MVGGSRTQVLDGPPYGCGMTGHQQVAQDPELPSVPDWERRFVYRITDVPSFALPARAEVLQDLYDLGESPEIVRPEWLDPDALAAIEDIDGTQLRVASAGRGASGVAIALQVVGLVATVGGAYAALAEGARIVKRIWQKLRGTRRGFISVSAGAAAYLAAADAIARASGSGEVRLLKFGPVDEQEEWAFSEFDVFFAIFELTDGALLFYTISNRGGVSFVGSAKRPPNP